MVTKRIIMTGKSALLFHNPYDPPFRTLSTGDEFTVIQGEYAEERDGKVFYPVHVDGYAAYMTSHPVEVSEMKVTIQDQRNTVYAKIAEHNDAIKGLTAQLAELDTLE